MILEGRRNPPCVVLDRYPVTVNEAFLVSSEARNFGAEGAKNGQDTELYIVIEGEAKTITLRELLRIVETHKRSR